MNNWVPLHNHTHFSLLDGVSKPKQIVKRCKELGYSACATTDHGNVGSHISFSTTMKKAGIKPILGCELYICQNNPKIKDATNDRPYSHLPVLAKNMQGWKNLIKIISFANHKDHFYYHPRIDLENLANLVGGSVIAFSGHTGSDMANAMFINPKAAYAQSDYDKVKTNHVHPDWEKRIYNLANQYIDAVGKENFFLEIQIIDPHNNPAGLIAARALRWLSKKYKIQRVATADSHYPRKTDAQDQRVLLVSAMQTTLSAMRKKIERGEEETIYFKSNFTGEHYHIPSYEEMQVWHDEEELVNAVRIADMCEEYEITRPPVLPTFSCPNGLSTDEYLEKLCYDGFRRKIKSDLNGDYHSRLQHELGVIKEAGLAGYFLIVQEYCNWARLTGIMRGPARGSCAGCLIAYLIGITSVDPLKYGLIFERFYNAGRNAPGHISLPDIDCDFERARRKEIIEHLKKVYGGDKVANIATFNSMKGRGALTDVLRAHDVPFEEVKRITANIPEESRITEELQAMEDRGEERSIIKYALQNDPESFKDWCVLNDDDTTSGTYANYFEQAMRLEGTKRNIGMHAAGVVISDNPLSENCPLIYNDEIDGYIAAWEYTDLEPSGQSKFDILVVASLDKIQGGRRLLRYGYIDEKDAI